MVGIVPGRAKGMQTFSTITVPRWHYELVTCERHRCTKWERGWKVSLDETLRQGKRRADYIRHRTKRRGWTETVDPSGVTVFTFPAGTPCFQDGRDQMGQTVFDCPPHKRQVRHALHVVSEGQATAVASQIAKRGRPESVIRAHRPVDWIDHLHESFDRMVDLSR